MKFGMVTDLDSAHSDPQPVFQKNDLDLRYLAWKMHYNNSISKQPGGDNGYREARGRLAGGRGRCLETCWFNSRTVLHHIKIVQTRSNKILTSGFECSWLNELRGQNSSRSVDFLKLNSNCTVTLVKIELKLLVRKIMNWIWDIRPENCTTQIASPSN
jgi:hypothetical protein